jgi:ligand-binding sensor domain-containing protein/signal transduction histidine kinase
MNRKFLFIVCLFYSNTLYLHAQQHNIRFEKISIEQGLSQNTVGAICQDHKGFLWFGTYDGLNRYDGYQFKIFKYNPNDSTSLCQNNVRCIFEDHFGVLWIGTEAGLSRYDRNKECFINYWANRNNPNSISDNMITDIFEDTNGMLWIATNNGLNKYNRNNNIFVKYFHNPDDPYSLCNNSIQTIYQDSKGILWIGTRNGLDYLNQKSAKFEHFGKNLDFKLVLGDSSINSIIEDSFHNIWIGTQSGGLTKVDRKNNKYSHFDFDLNDPSDLRSNGITGILEDRDHDLWVTTIGGLEKYDRKKNNFIHYQRNFKDPFSLSSNAILCIYEDKIGIIWLGTFFSGINKFDKRKNQFIYYGFIPGTPNGLPDNVINSFYEDPTDKGKTIWVGTAQKGFGLLNRTNDQFTFYSFNSLDKNSPSNNIVETITKDKYGMLWICTSNGLNKFNIKTKKFIRYFHDPKNPLSISVNLSRYVFEDKSGNIWITTVGGGLELYDRKRDGFIHYKNNPEDPFSISDNILWSIQEDNSGNLWIGTNDAGLDCLDKSTGKFIHYKNIKNDPKSISNNKVLCLYHDSSDNIWVGTAGGGLNKFNPKTKVFTHYGIEDGLTSKTIHAILEDKNKNLWISTPQGLFRFDIQKSEFINYNVYDGLQSNEFLVNSACKSVTGELFFGGINGFNVFNPDKIKSGDYKSNIVLTDFQIFNKQIPIGEWENDRVILEKSISETQKIILSYQDAVFSFEFAFLDFTAPIKNMYAYMMEGFDKSWNYVGKRNFAAYTKLPAGSYTFKVKGSKNGVWDNSYTSIEIIITPPFWETWWFRISGSLLIFGILAISYKKRTARIRKYNKELEIRVKDRTTQLENANKELESFAYSVSHDLRAPLRAIDGFGHAIQEDYKDVFNDQAKDFMNRIRQNSQKMSILIDDLLNMSRIARKELDARTVDLSKVAYDTYKELTEFIKDRKIELKLTKDMFDTADPQLIKLTFQNLLDNAIKFTKNEEIAFIDVGFIIQDERKIYYIKDNGVGFNENYSSKLFGVFQRLHTQDEFPGTGIGLATVQKIINKHGGKIWAESQINVGSTFYFTLNEIVINV